MSKFMKDISLERSEGTRETRERILPDADSQKIIRQFKGNISSIRSKFNVFNELNKNGQSIILF